MEQKFILNGFGFASLELRKAPLGSAMTNPETGSSTARTLHLNFQKNGLDNGVHFPLSHDPGSWPVYLRKHEAAKRQMRRHRKGRLTKAVTHL